MNDDRRWLLPAGIEELLPGDAWRMERLRRDLLDLFRCWGFELVVPPLIEYADSLLSGAGDDLDLQTFKLIDQETGRLLGVRADMTPQVARIEARYLHRLAPSRLCYLGPVLHTRSNGLGAAREPMQVGAELYGSSDPAADSEVIALMAAALARAGLGPIRIDLGHVGVFRALMHAAGIAPPHDTALFESVQRRAASDIRAHLDAAGAGGEYADLISAVVDCNGAAGDLPRVARELATAGAPVARALANLGAVLERVEAQLPDATVGFDLAELRGYQYHTGVAFAAYVPGYGKEIARGGRYDDIGRWFGRGRPATGFSLDARQVLALVGDSADTGADTILAPMDPDTDCQRLIEQLRARGKRVVADLPGAAGEWPPGCDRSIVRRGNTWVVAALTTGEAGNG